MRLARLLRALGAEQKQVGFILWFRQQAGGQAVRCPESRC